jgi:hypothetical protein
MVNVQSLLVQRRWSDLFLDLPSSNPPHLDLGLGAAAWGTHFRLEANFEELGWLASMIFDMGGAFLIREGKIVVLKF